MWFLPPFRPLAALADFARGSFRWQLWSRLAWNDLITRYRRSWLGVGWVFISFCLFVAAKVTIFSVLSSQSIAYFAVYLSVGYLIFRFLSNIIVDGAAVFVNAETWIKSESLPLSIYVYRSILRNLIVATYSLLPVIAICVYFRVYSVNFALSIAPVLAVYFLNAFWVSALLGLLSTRHRDLSHLLATGMSIVYFLTPVLWVPEDIGSLASIAQYNPFTHFIAIARTPLLEGTIPILSWQVVGGITAGGMLLVFLLFSFFRHRIVFWL